MQSEIKSMAVMARDRQSGAQPVALLALAALGVVYGDLGTSPLYALQEAFNPEHGVQATPENVVGVVSLFLWSLILMVSVKYVLVLMRADNKGEGGILALLAQITGEKPETGKRSTAAWVLLGLAGAAMLYGDGVITPAVSVLSAMEGMQVATPALAAYVVPCTVVILVLLFMVQPYGSGRVGVAFGPILATWFVAIAALGIAQLWQNPAILQAINPIHGLTYFQRNGFAGFVSLGAVVLCLTGAEALYADMGHFGARPIRLAWYGLALPSLVLSYLGQGALLLAHPQLSGRPFYSMVPEWGLYPMVALSTLATIVASQALITAVFSLTHQSVQLGFFPRVKVLHTSGSHKGQIYLPLLNWILMLATVAVVLGFRQSDKLAAAFGLAVSTTMAITTVLFAVLARRRWHWPWWAVIVVAGGLFAIDLAFWLANVLKFLDGGWLPLLLGLIVFAMMGCWFGGRRLQVRDDADRQLPIDLLLSSLQMNPPPRIPGTAVFLSESADGTPLVLLHHLKHNQVLHETVLLLTLQMLDSPRVDGERVGVQWLGEGVARVMARYGYMEEPDVPAVMERAAELLGLAEMEPLSTTYYLGRQTLVAAAKSGRFKRWMLGMFSFLRQNERSATLYFRLPPNRVVELGARIEL
ncbi:potassium transporter Kup [Chromobacterium sp. IIBBL 290-4]|uniref:potassium transporter Kup n=1 Tax=Chromobacterium sp. IIBBL 290-4 TaxID=2953890 RepID=UPI0020B75695|nr:KUP/HAK/KT family potassium transporter [Chromobacterium sp. IIBBL 290-4]UTH74038.1 KUP/HAK/KT family potassium transporter [Chromobacterium sp. IIBBL 290-4]